MTLSKSLICLGAAAALAGCNTMPQQSLYRWAPGKATGITPTASASTPEVSVTSQPVDPPGALSVRTLPERAAAAYIAGISKAASGVDDYRTQVAKPIKRVDPNPAELQRVFVIDVQRVDVRPSDRFTSLKVEIEPNDPRFHFVDYQGASTLNTSISIGTVSISNQTTGSLSLGPIGAGTTQLSATAGYTNTNASTHNINETAQLSVNVSPRWITVQRMGAEGMDLTGNILVQAAIQVPESLLDTYYVVEPDVFDDKANAFRKAVHAKLNGSLTDFLRPQEISVCYRATYIDRVVQSGDETRDEGAQAVEFRKVSLPLKKSVVVSEHETRTAVWYLTDKLGVLMTRTPSGYKTLLFDDYDKAQIFKAWLQDQHPSQAGSQDVVGPDHNALSAAAFGELVVKRGFPRSGPGDPPADDRSNDGPRCDSAAGGDAG